MTARAVAALPRAVPLSETDGDAEASATTTMDAAIPAAPNDRHLTNMDGTSDSTSGDSASESTSRVISPRPRLPIWPEINTPRLAMQRFAETGVERLLGPFAASPVEPPRILLRWTLLFSRTSASGSQVSALSTESSPKEHVSAMHRVVRVPRWHAFSAVTVVVVALIASQPVLAKDGRTLGESSSVIKVTAGKPSELAFQLSKSSLIPAGRITFDVVNRGKVSHDFKICTAVIKSDSANSCVGKATKTLKPGQSATLVVTIAKKGEYEFLCSVPGHAHAGMKGLLGVGVKVAAPPTPTTTPKTTTATTTTTR